MNDIASKSPLNDRPDIILRYGDGTEQNINDLGKSKYEEFLTLVKNIAMRYSGALKAKELKEEST